MNRKYHPKYSNDEYKKKKEESRKIWNERHGCFIHDVVKHTKYESYTDFLLKKEPISVMYRITS